LTTPGPNGTTITYSYDIENRLIQTSDGFAMSYDPLGRLYEAGGGSSDVIRYLYDGDALAAESRGPSGSRRTALPITGGRSWTAARNRPDSRVGTSPSRPGPAIARAKPQPMRTVVGVVNSYSGTSRFKGAGPLRTRAAVS
jgi:hypothetical protein